MSDQQLHIWYCPQETGPAELLEGRLARIIDVPLLTDDFWQNDLVRLTDSESPDGRPVIQEVVFRRYPYRTNLVFDDLAECALLCTVFAITGSDVHVLFEPHDGRKGRLVVAHGEGIDPEGLAEALGIEQEFGDLDVGVQSGSEDPEGDRECKERREDDPA